MGLLSRIKGASDVLAQSLGVLLNSPSLFIYSLLSAASGVLVRLVVLGAIIATPSVREPLLDDIRILSKAAYEGIKTDIQRDRAERVERETGLKPYVAEGPHAEQVFASLKAPSISGGIAVIALGILVTPIAILGRGLFRMALMCAATNVLRGAPKDFGANVGQAVGRLPALVGWGLVVIYFTMLRDSAARRLWIGEGIFRSITSAAGRAVSLFVMPAMVMDGLGPIDALRRSVESIKRVWGEGAVIAVTLSPLRGPMMLIDGGLMFLGVCLLPASLIGGIALVLLGLATLLAYRTFVRAVDAVAYLALYQYASAGEVVAGFGADELQGALKVRWWPW